MSVQIEVIQKTCVLPNPNTINSRAYFLLRLFHLTTSTPPSDCISNFQPTIKMFANSLISWFSSKESTPNTTSDATSIENHQPTSPKAPSTDCMVTEKPVRHTRLNYPKYP